MVNRSELSQGKSGDSLEIAEVQRACVAPPRILTGSSGRSFSSVRYLIGNMDPGFGNSCATIWTDKGRK
jgi:hypothetical protein